MSARDNCRQYLPEAEHFLMYHFIASGACWVEVDGEAPVRVAAGDLVMFPQGAAQLMRTAGRPIAAVAEEIGHESEAAFNRAFKREFGVPPAAWRRQSATAAAVR